MLVAGLLVLACSSLEELKAERDRLDGEIASRLARDADVAARARARLRPA